MKIVELMKRPKEALGVTSWSAYAFVFGCPGAVLLQAGFL